MATENIRNDTAETRSATARSEDIVKGLLAGTQQNDATLRNVATAFFSLVFLALMAVVGVVGWYVVWRKIRRGRAAQT